MLSVSIHLHEDLAHGAEVSRKDDQVWDESSLNAVLACVLRHLHDLSWLDLSPADVSCRSARSRSVLVCVFVCACVCVCVRASLRTPTIFRQSLANRRNSPFYF